MTVDAESRDEQLFVDRRHAPRFDRVLRLKYSHDAVNRPALTRDIGPSGAYLLTPGVPEPGENITLELKQNNQGAPAVELVARVVRRVRRTTEENVMPGSALHWVKAQSSGSPEYLQRVLKSTIGLEAAPAADASGGSYYKFDQT